MADPNPADDLCAMCNQPGINACSGCHSIRYCSKLCQKTDWPLHKLLCKKYADFSDASRPQSYLHLYKRAIFFPELGERLRFIWMRFHGPDTAGRVIVDMHYTNPGFENLQNVNELVENMVLHRQLGRCISIAGRGWPIAKENMDFAGEENQSLVKIDKELSQWIHGPIIAMGVNGPFTTDGMPKKVPWHEQVYDLEPIDLRHIVDRMRVDHYMADFDRTVYQYGVSEKIKGVRVNCKGDSEICHRPNYEAVDVSSALCNEETDVQVKSADKIGIPLVFRKLPQALCWRGRLEQGTMYSSNPHAALLDLKAQCNGFTSVESFADIVAEIIRMANFNDIAGSYVVVRKDGEPLTPDFLDALGDYSSAKVSNLAVCLAIEGVEYGDLEGRAMSLICKEDWEAFYAEFVAKKQSSPSS